MVGSVRRFGKTAVEFTEIRQGLNFALSGGLPAGKITRLYGENKMKLYKLDVGDYSRVRKGNKIVRVVTRYLDTRPGDESISAFYTGEGLDSDPTIIYWEDELSDPINGLEALAWAMDQE